MIMIMLSVILFAISSSLDNLVIGTAYGLKKIKIRLTSNIIIAIITSLGTFLAMYLGEYITEFLPVSIADSLGAVVILLVGVYFVVQSGINHIRDKKATEVALKDIDAMVEYADESDLNKSGSIEIKEAILVSIGLSVNNLGSGIAASLTGLPIYTTVITTFIFSIITIIVGQYLGSSLLGRFFGRYSPMISGVLLVLLGIAELLH